MAGFGAPPLLGGIDKAGSGAPPLAFPPLAPSKPEDAAEDVDFPPEDAAAHERMCRK